MGACSPSMTRAGGSPADVKEVPRDQDSRPDVARPRPSAPLRGRLSAPWWGAHIFLEENPPVRLHDFEDFLDDENAYDERRSRPRKPKRSEKETSDRFGFAEQDDVFDPQSTRAGRLTEQERARLAAVRESALAAPPLPPGMDRWSTWGDGEQGPHPRPEWVVTELAAADSELGVLKTGRRPMSS
jgi:RIO kinase 1